jgi:uncharacterized protein
MSEQIVERFTLPCEVKLTNAEVPEGEQPRLVIVGTAINYGSRSVDVGGYVRQFRAGAFSGSLGRVEVFSLYAHDDNDIVGRQKNGSLRLLDSEQGLTFELDPPAFDPKFVGRVSSGLVDKVSVGVTNAVDNWYTADDGVVVRDIVTADLLELSFTAYPAFGDTSAEMRMLNDYLSKQQPARSQTVLLRLIQQHAEMSLGID